MDLYNSVHKNLKTTQHPIVIFGASYIGKIAHEYCTQNNIPVECFCDNNSGKNGKRLLDTEIKSIEQIKLSYADAFFIIAVTDIQDVVKQLNNLDYDLWCGAGELLYDYSWRAEKNEFNDIRVNNPANYGNYILNTCISSHSNFKKNDNLYIRSIDLVITEKCSLRCRDCANLMQYFTNPQNSDISKVIASTKILDEVCDEINEIRVIGGEPFMNKEWSAIVEALKQYKNINYIIIYTNGTILPKKEQLLCLKEDNIFVNITDYGEISKNSEKLAEALEKNSINYFYYSARGWTACGSIKKRLRSPEEKKEIFAKCCAKNLTTFIEGKLFRCPFAANLDRLIDIPDGDLDHANLLAMSSLTADRHAFREKIRHYLYDIETLKSCDYCAGRFLSDIEIEPAVQADGVLEISI